MPYAPRKEPAPTSLTEQQKTQVAAYMEAHPDGGYKAACRSAGGPLARVTRKEARALIMADDDLREAALRGLRLDESTLFRRLGDIANDVEHKDQFRAVTWGLNAIHRWHENQTVEHSGSMEVTHPDVDAAIGRLLDELARGREAPAAVKAAPRALGEGGAD